MRDPRPDAAGGTTRRPGRILAALAALAGTLCACVPARCIDEPADLTFGAGAVDVGLLQSETLTSGGALVEVRGPRFRALPRGLRPLRPVAGLQATSRGGRYAYCGLQYDIRLGRGFYFTPSGVIGAHDAGSGRDLGQDLEFRSGLALGYRFRSGHRLGLLVTHISNGNLSPVNPGEESVFLTWSVPLGERRAACGR